jgi:enediyne polyketide synthase
MALGEEVEIFRRSDGKPFVEGANEVSAAHTNDLTLAVSGHGPLACDIEQVLVRPASVWLDLLGEHRYGLASLIARSAGEDEGISRARVWTATECLKKAGAAAHAPLILTSLSADGWVLLSSGSLIIATYVASLLGNESKVVIALLMGKV